MTGLLLAVLLFTADNALIPEESAEEFATDCMYRLVGLLKTETTTIDREAAAALRAALQPNSVVLKKSPCKWKSVCCDHGYAVNTISWRCHYHMGYAATPLGFLRLCWLPSTIQELSLYDYHRADIDRLNVRNFPRESRFVTLFQCGLKGTVETAALPKLLERLSLKGNFLSGTVHLVSLPEKLKRLYMSENPIHTLYVDTESLSTHFVHASFGSKKSRLQERPINVFSLSGPLDGRFEVKNARYIL